MKYPKPYQHEGASKLVVRTLLRVRREIKQWNIREVARRLEVNPKFVFDNLTKGIEPTDKTEKGQAVRLKLGLSRIKKKPKVISDKPKKMKPDFIKEWDHLPTNERHKVIQDYLRWKNKS